MTADDGRARATALPVLGAQQPERLKAFLAHERPPPAKPPTHTTNDVSDIAGARPLLKDHVYVNKPHFHEPSDIAGSCSKELHPRHRSSPQPSGFRTNRVVNPMQPEYKLPSFQAAPPLIPKFLRDSYDVSDIAGTSFRPKIIANPRSPMRVSHATGLEQDDIAGAQAGWLPFHKRGMREHPPRDILDVADIVNVDFKSSRVTDVLNPVYKVNGMTYQDDALSHPKLLHPQRDKPSYALQTADIAGANPFDASKTVVGGIPNEKRRHFRQTNRTDDITGATADTVLHSIRSNRRVDPTWPEYVALDGQRVDSTAMSVARSIVFADLIRTHDRQDVQGDDDGEPAPYVVAGIANIGLTGGTNDRRARGLKDKPRRRSTAPAVVLTGEAKRSTAAPPASSTHSSRVSPAERKQMQERREEIQLVRELQ
ncbi:hypothetical protein P43SY_003291 [Pythium insidiosum]|uniref:Uncharacterized protein n=1 Tax=Pythium insidiosum TaxID=114742 RepID=A0AAD5LD08_PYTIN|nr:hypothetical protein P43SY_003291 [Pythium insidiosum]